MENKEQPRKTIIDIQFGLGGHENEYIITTPYTAEDNVPSEWEDKLQEKLGQDWSVMGRGTRIEIRGKDGQQDHDLIRRTMIEVAGDNYKLS